MTSGTTTVSRRAAGRAHNTLPVRHRRLLRNAFALLERDHGVISAGAVIGQQDAEPLIVDQALGKRPILRSSSFSTSTELKSRLISFRSCSVRDWRTERR